MLEIVNVRLHLFIICRGKTFILTIASNASRDLQLSTPSAWEWKDINRRSYTKKMRNFTKCSKTPPNLTHRKNFKNTLTSFSEWNRTSILIIGDVIKIWLPLRLSTKKSSHWEWVHIGRVLQYFKARDCSHPLCLTLKGKSRKIYPQLKLQGKISMVELMKRNFRIQHLTQNFKIWSQRKYLRARLLKD